MMEKYEQLQCEMEKLTYENAELKKRLADLLGFNFQILTRDDAVMTALHNTKAHIYQIDIENDYVGAVRGITVEDLADSPNVFYAIKKGVCK